MNTYNDLLRLIQHGRIREALEQLARQMTDEDHDTRLLILQIMARHSRLERDRRLGIRSQGDLDIEQNQITYHLIELIDDLRSDAGQIDPEPRDDYPAEKMRILFCSASPVSQSTPTGQVRLARLASDTELRDIQEILRGASHRDRFDLKSIVATTPDHLLRELMTFKPHIFHFSGHGSPGGLHFQNQDGNSQEISKSRLGDIFQFFRATIGCVFLNACYSAHQAESIAKFIPLVIGTGSKIRDTTAIHYAKRFYEAIGEGQDPEYAFNYARLSMQVNEIGEGEEMMVVGNKD